jgi:hypothetical protein
MLGLGAMVEDRGLDAAAFVGSAGTAACDGGLGIPALAPIEEGVLRRVAKEARACNLDIVEADNFVVASATVLLAGIRTVAALGGSGLGAIFNDGRLNLMPNDGVLFKVEPLLEAGFVGSGSSCVDIVARRTDAASREVPTVGGASRVFLFIGVMAKDEDFTCARTVPVSLATAGNTGFALGRGVLSTPAFSGDERLAVQTIRVWPRKVDQLYL